MEVGRQGGKDVKLLEYVGRQGCREIVKVIKQVGMQVG